MFFKVLSCQVLKGKLGFWMGVRRETDSVTVQNCVASSAYSLWVSIDCKCLSHLHSMWVSVWLTDVKQQMFGSSGWILLTADFKVPHKWRNSSGFLQQFWLLYKIQLYGAKLWTICTQLIVVTAAPATRTFVLFCTISIFRWWFERFNMTYSRFRILFYNITQCLQTVWKSCIIFSSTTAWS